MKKIMVAGIDGYLGTALKYYLEEKGYKVFGFDNGLRKDNVDLIGSESLTHKAETNPVSLDLRTDYQELEELLAEVMPDAIIHFAEQPSAPFSMRSVDDAVETQENNISGTMNLLWAMKEVCPKAHLIKLGTMGVYGTPDEPIEEHNGAVAYDPGSFYHISKACDSLNVRKSCEWWGLNATDLHQGVVYGHINNTRFDYDSYFGTAINRFITQALIEHPLTVYGKGDQTRGFIYIEDTMKCIELAILNPPKGYRVFNQITETFSINYLAQKVSDLTGVEIEHLDNPRIEREEHPYQVTHKRLFDLGLEPKTLQEVLPHFIKKIKPFKGRIKEEVIRPQTSWK